MKICGNDNKVKTNFTSGCLYSSPFCEIAIYNEYHKLLLSLIDGSAYSNPIGASWTDVTDQYCLTKVK